VADAGAAAPGRSPRRVARLGDGAVHRILVVEDERSCRELLVRTLWRGGHEVLAAAGGREAIEVGCRLQPDLLVVDWILRDAAHGLHVAEAIGAVVPGLATLLVTGFASRDLAAAAARARVARLIEKPFEPDALREAADAALRLPPPPGRGGVAALETDAEGRVLHRNAAAARLLRERALDPRAATLSALLGCAAAPLALAAARDWVRLPARGGASADLLARTHEPRVARTQLWLLRREGERLSPALVELVLAVEERLELRWPWDGRVLVVDDDELHRLVAVATLEGAGATSLAAETDALALRLVEHDEGIEVLVVDHEMPGTDLGSFLARARRLRPGIRIVGNSAYDRSEEFAKLGVQRFVQKPWRACDLLAALRR
jgi:CheY-like chemotaxis protein